MYWSAWGVDGSRQDGQIVRTSMDGIISMILFDNRSVTWPSGLTLDYQTRSLYWIDASKDVILKSDADGLNYQNILELNKTFFLRRWHGFGLEYFNDNLYFGEWFSDTVLSFNVISPNHTLTRVIEANHDTGSLHVLDLLRQPAGESESLNSYRGIKILQSIITIGDVKLYVFFGEI